MKLVRTGDGSRRAVLAFGVSVLVALAAWAQNGVKVTKVDPPDRNGAAAGKGDNTQCPPGPDTMTKGMPDPALGDVDKDGDGRRDFYMGEYNFVKGDKDLHVKKWCLNKAANGDGTFGDYFTQEIVVTEQNQPDVVAVPAGDEAT